jgi:hypothetical protein
VLEVKEYTPQATVHLLRRRAAQHNPVYIYHLDFLQAKLHAPHSEQTIEEVRRAIEDCGAVAVVAQPLAPAEVLEHADGGATTGRIFDLATNSWVHPPSATVLRGLSHRNLCISQRVS